MNRSSEVDDVNSFCGELPNQALPRVTVHLIKKDQRQLNREANHMSKRIYKDKHKAKTN
jgi:hypothetical protein